MSKFAERLATIGVDVEKPQRMIVLGFDGQPLLGADGSRNYIDIFSSDSEIARQHQRAVTTQRLAMRRNAKPTAVELEKSSLDLLAVLTAGWGTIGKDGVATPDADFSTEAARALYADPKNAELRSQVDEFAGQRANFSQALSTNS